MRSRLFLTHIKLKMIQNDSIVFKQIFDLVGLAYVLRAWDFQQHTLLLFQISEIAKITPL